MLSVTDRTLIDSNLSNFFHFRKKMYKNDANFSNLNDFLNPFFQLVDKMMPIFRI